MEIAPIGVRDAFDRGTKISMAKRPVCWAKDFATNDIEVHVDLHTCGGDKSKFSKIIRAIDRILMER